MASHCPKCNHDIDTQANFDCLKCGEQFWQSREAFDKREKKSSEIESEQKVEQEEKTYSLPALPKNFWWKFVVSVRFSDYFLKGFLSAIVLNVLGFSIGLSVKSEKIGDIIIQSFAVLMLVYWISITIGYIYGFVKFRQLSKTTHTKKELEKAKKNEQIFCPKCGKKIDDDSSFCIFCGSKVLKVHNYHKH